MDYVQLEQGLAIEIVKDLGIFSQIDFLDIDIDPFYTLFSWLLVPLGGSMRTSLLPCIDRGGREK